jgi:hypothetical protein
MLSPAKVNAGEFCLKISLALDANAKVPSPNKAEDFRKFFLLILDFIMMLYLRLKLIKDILLSQLSKANSINN